MQDQTLKWASVLFLFTITLSFSLTFYYRAPYHDHWDIVPLFASQQAGSLAMGDLFALHGNHWHASGYAVMLGLAEVTGMRHWVECLASVLFAGVGFVALARLLDRSVAVWSVPQIRIWLFGIAAFFLFSLDQAGNWLWGWQVAVFINIAGTLWTIERLSAGPPHVTQTSVAALAAMAAIYGFGTGWVLLPIGYALLLLQGAWRGQHGLSSLLIWTIMSAWLFWHFAQAFNAPTAAYSASALPDLLDPKTWLGLMHYTLNFVASPIVRFARDSAVPATLIGLGLISWSVRTLYRTDKTRVWTNTAPFLALAAYGVGAGMLTAIGRFDMFGTDQAFVSRYITFGNLFWIAVFSLVMLAMASQPKRTHRNLTALLSLLFLLKLGNIPSVVNKSVQLSQQIQTRAEQLNAMPVEPRPEDYLNLHHPAHDIGGRIEVLRQHRVSLYADYPEEAD